ncbi:hypothetical protein Pfo_027588 [Paulownia fortunei]|nr:hypothetical protein Pfo_027588 [Paulownia fortunei]
MTSIVIYVFDLGDKNFSTSCCVHHAVYDANAEYIRFEQKSLQLLRASPNDQFSRRSLAFRGRGRWRFTVCLCVLIMIILGLSSRIKINIICEFDNLYMCKLLYSLQQKLGKIRPA